MLILQYMKRHIAQGKFHLNMLIQSKHYIDYGRVYVMLQIYLKKMPRKHFCRPIFPKKLAVEPI